MHSTTINILIIESPLISGRYGHKWRPAYDDKFSYKFVTDVCVLRALICFLSEVPCRLRLSNYSSKKTISIENSVGDGGIVFQQAAENTLLVCALALLLEKQFAWW